MRKLILLTVVLFLVALSIRAQEAQNLSPKDLLSAIQKSKPDTNRISLQVKLASYYLFKPGEFKNDLDSSLNFFSQATALSNKLHEVDWQYRILLLMGNYYSEAGDLERSQQCFRSVIAHYHQIGNRGKEADALNWIGYWYNDNNAKDEDEKREGFYRRAFSLYLQDHQPVKAADALTGVASMQTTNKQFDMAENSLKQALTLYETSGYKALQNTYFQLYLLEFAKGNYYSAITYASAGIKSMKVSGDTTIAERLYQAMGRCNFAVKNYEAALGWIKKAIASGSEGFTLKCKFIQTLILLNRTEEARSAINKLKEEHPITIYDTLNQYRTFAIYYEKINQNDLAIQYYTQIFKLGLDRNKPDEYYIWMVICDDEIASIYLKINQPVKAEKYLIYAALLFKNTLKSMDPRFLEVFYDNSYKYDVATGKYQEAVKNLEQRDRLQDSLFTVDNDNKIAELNITYQTAQKEQSIKDLHNQATVERARVEKANLQRNITVGGIFAMILVSVLFYRNYRQKQAANNIITQKNELLQHLLTEKEWLLKEVHHRVKNNLHTIICLLESQARYLENDALKAIENSQHRIYAMSLIHQKLYQSDDIKTIDMAEYIPELVKSLEDGFDTSNQIQFKLKIDPVNLDISHAIPLGLIINEAVTNSIKYAFPNSRKGEISISMTDSGQKIKLELADNGIGMPQIDHEAEPESMGLRLMKGLSEDIDADISFEVDNGTRISITFGHNALNEPENILKTPQAKEIDV